MTLTVHTASERPDLFLRGVPSAEVWPEYNLHGDVLNRWWDHLDEELGDFQFTLYDQANDQVVGEGHTGPLWWEGEDSTLPDGIDDSIEEMFARVRAGEPVNTLCALAAEVHPASRSKGLSEQLLRAMRSIAERHGLSRMVAPVRPSLKERYPITPIETYAAWRRPDGRLLDPWMRVHERLGARVVRPLPRSMRITGTIEEWESWTGMVFPDSGDYVFPHGLAPLHVDVAAGLGCYWEPNVWMAHPDLRPAGPS